MGAYKSVLSIARLRFEPSIAEMSGALRAASPILKIEPQKHLSFLKTNPKEVIASEEFQTWDLKSQAFTTKPTISGYLPIKFSPYFFL